jgi:hypothetical protein
VILIEINNKPLSVPQSWNELTGRQLVEVMNVLFVKKYSGEEKVLQLLRIVFSMNRREYRRVSVFDIDEFLYLMHFLVRDKIDLTRNLIPKYRHINVFGIWEEFYGPDDECNNLIMEEFVFAENYFMEWFENKDDEELLSEFVAILYRPGRKDYDYKRNPKGDYREDFNENTSHYNAKKFIKLWPKSLKLSIAYWFSGCWHKWVQDNPNVFSGSGEPSQYGMVSVMRNVAKDGIYGDFNQVGRTYVNQILMELNEVVAEAEKMKREAKA